MNRPIITELEAKIREQKAQLATYRAALDRSEEAFINAVNANSKMTEIAIIEPLKAQLAKYREALEKIYKYRSDKPDWNMIMAIAGDVINPMDMVLSGDEGKHD